MKRNIYYSLLILILGFEACKETPPDIEFKHGKSGLGDTTYIISAVPAADLKNVLIEDFTGMQCVNCPAGHEKGALIQAAYPGRVMIAGIHPTNSLLTVPYAGQPDFRLSEGYTLNNFLGVAQLPAGAFNRNELSAGTFVSSLPTNWDGYASAELNKTTPFNLKIENGYDSNSRELNIKTVITTTQAASDTISLTIYIIESGILASQEDRDTSTGASYERKNYMHNHILRKILTPTLGKQFTRYSLEKGRVFENYFKYTLPANWVDKNCAVIAFVHKSGLAAKAVWQVEEEKVR